MKVSINTNMCWRMGHLTKAFPQRWTDTQSCHHRCSRQCQSSEEDPPPCFETGPYLWKKHTFRISHKKVIIVFQVSGTYHAFLCALGILEMSNRGNMPAVISSMVLHGQELNQVSESPLSCFWICSSELD